MGLGLTSPRSRIHAILCTCAIAVLLSSWALLWRRAANEARIVALLALRTAKMNGKPNLALYAPLSSLNRCKLRAK